MKLIHCADLHLDSRMESGLPPEKAGSGDWSFCIHLQKWWTWRQKTAWKQFLLCGDLFDAGKVSVRARNCVLNASGNIRRFIFII